MSWESRVFLLKYRDFLHLKSNFPHLKSDFPCTKSNLPKSAFYFLWRLSAFFNGFLTFFNGFLLSPTAFRNSPTAFQFSSTAFRFPRNPRKSFYGEKYTKDCYSSFVFFATHSPSFVITDKQYLRDYPTPRLLLWRSNRRTMDETASPKILHGQQFAVRWFSLCVVFMTAESYALPIVVELSGPTKDTQNCPKTMRYHDSSGW